MKALCSLNECAQPIIPPLFRVKIKPNHLYQHASKGFVAHISVTLRPTLHKCETLNKSSLGKRFLLKDYLRYKTFLCHKVVLDLHLIFFFI